MALCTPEIHPLPIYGKAQTRHYMGDHRSPSPSGHITPDHTGDRRSDFRSEEVTITRHGKEVARLVPARAGFSREAARAAAQRIRAMSKGVTLGKLKIKDLINEGRRF